LKDISQSIDNPIFKPLFLHSPYYIVFKQKIIIDNF
jgi:hypothetical protein